MEPIIYKSFIIQIIQEGYYNSLSINLEYMVYRIEGSQSSCVWFSTIEDAKAQIDEWEEQNADDLRLYELERKG